MEALKTLDLHYTYPDGTQALKGLELAIQKGERTAILGSNGAGKTTLFYCLNGIYTPTTGNVFVNGRELTKTNVNEIRREIGMVFQNPDDQLFAPTVYQDVAFGPRNIGLPEGEVEARVADSLKMMGIYHLRDRPPHNLSAGQKHRAAIAGALAMGSEILVLDEPLSNLDPSGSEELVGVLSELNKEYGTTVILSTHSINAVGSWAENVVVLDEGRVLASGMPEEIFKDEKLLRKAKLNAPITVQAFRDFEARGIVSKKEKKIDTPLTVLDLVDGVESDVIVRYAIASTDFKSGDKAGLVLRDGVIYAVQDADADTFGRVLYSAKVGDDIALIALGGKIRTQPGRIYVVKIPSTAEGGSRAVVLDELRDKIKEMNPGRIAAMGTSAKAVVRKLDLECNYDVDVVNASISAALRGIDVAILASGKMAEHAVKKIDENNRKNNRCIECLSLSV
ncbi:MAG: ATP-binding cassette domain-containing protein [Candidatus Hydrothermarchaeales archaeon]